MPSSDKYGRARYTKAERTQFNEALRTLHSRFAPGSAVQTPEGPGRLLGYFGKLLCRVQLEDGGTLDIAVTKITAPSPAPQK